jgi:hypothetical protein
LKPIQIPQTTTSRTTTTVPPTNNNKKSLSSQAYYGIALGKQGQEGRQKGAGSPDILKKTLVPLEALKWSIIQPTRFIIIPTILCWLYPSKH